MPKNTAYTLDLWHGEGIERQEGTSRADNAAKARQEMQDTGSHTLMDAIAEAPRTRRKRSTSDIPIVGPMPAHPCPECGQPCSLNASMHIECRAKADERAKLPKCQDCGMPAVDEKGTEGKFCLECWKDRAGNLYPERQPAWKPAATPQAEAILKLHRKSSVLNRSDR